MQYIRRRLRILLLEENPFARTLYEQRARVRASSLRVDTVSTIPELFARLERFDLSYDLVVCDGPRGAGPTVAALPAMVEELVRRGQAVAVISDRPCAGLDHLDGRVRVLLRPVSLDELVAVAREARNGTLRLARTG